MSRLTNSNEVEQLSSRFAHLDSQSALAAPDTGDFTNLSVNSSGRRRRRRRNKSKPNENIKDQIPRSSSIGQEPISVSIQSVERDAVGNALIHIKPRGFQNVKNSCYLNVSLQLLFHIPQFCGVLSTLRQTAPDRPTRNDSFQILDTNSSTRLLPLMLRLFSQFAPCTSCLLSDLSRGASSTTARSSSKSGDNARGSHKLSSGDHGPPTDIILLDKVDRVRPVDLGTPVLPGDSFLRALCLDTGFQEDCAECLTQMLAKLHEEMALLSGETQNTKADTAVNEDDDESDWIVTDRTGKRRPMARKTELDGGASPISRLFSGILLNCSTVNHAKHATVRGRGCGSTGSSSNPVSVDELARNATHVSVKEPFFILPLEISDPKVTSVESALFSLSNREEVSDYLDPLTGMASTLRRHTCLDQLPPFFLFQLKRFTVNQSSNAPGGKMGKSLKLIPVQQELLIPSKLLSGEKQFSIDQRTYRLQSVIFHVGLTAHSGHYTVAVRCCPELLAKLERSVTRHPVDTRNPPLSSVSRPSFTFLYLDDTHGCLIPDGEPQRLLFATHRPLDVQTGQFRSLPNINAVSPADRTSVGHQPRTPYVLVYESVLSCKRTS